MVNQRALYFLSVAVALSVSLYAPVSRVHASCPVDLPADNFNLRVAEVDGRLRVELVSEGKLLLCSPKQGLWSIATDWAGDWPAGWKHASPASVRRSGPWVVLEGKLKTENGTWKLEDAYRPVEEGSAVKCVRRWEWNGKSPAEKTTLSVRWQSLQPGELLLPGNCYYGNPSGVKTGRGLVPRFESKPGQILLVEEHRCPMPFASLESAGNDGVFQAALHSLPSRVPEGNVEDQWWSIGAAGLKGRTELKLLSGPVAMNGKLSVVKSGQRKLSRYPDTWINFDNTPGVIEKIFFLQVQPVKRRGSGFQPAVRTSIRLFKPFSLYGLPATESILASKYRFAKSRWHEDGESAGFRMYPHNNMYVMGWAGQSEAPPFAFLEMPGQFPPEAVSMAQRALDHLAESPFNQSGFKVRYDPDKNKWSGQDPVSQGQAMYHFALAIEAGRKIKDVDSSKWETFLRRACEVHARRILSDKWRPVSTNEGFLAAPLCKGYELFGEPGYRDAAIKAAQHYADRHLDMSEPYWGGTLDASCEDKEGAWAGFQAFLAVYSMTGKRKYLRWAEHAMDVALTYTCVWDIDMPAGRLQAHNLKTHGWTSVSVQNQHLDLYAVVYAPEIYRMGRLLERPSLKRLAKVMYRTCGQMIDPGGSQGEQVNHTNFVQRGGLAENVYELRGTYAEEWTVFWMTAHFLTAAAKFHQMGVVP